MLFMDACTLTDSENCYEEENEMFDADFNEDGDSWNNYRNNPLQPLNFIYPTSNVPWSSDVFRGYVKVWIVQ